MFRAAIRSLLARKVRLILTGLVGRARRRLHGGHLRADRHDDEAFNDLVDDRLRADRRPRPQLRTPSPRQTEQPARNASRCPSRCSRTVEAVPGVARRRRGRDRLRADRRPGDRRRDRRRSARRPPPRRGTSERLHGSGPEGAPPQGSDEVVDRRGDGRDERHPRGRHGRRSCSRGRRASSRSSGVAGFGEADSLFGATLARCSTSRRRSRCSASEGQFDTISVVAEPGVSGVQLQREIYAGAARRASRP